ALCWTADGGLHLRPAIPARRCRDPRATSGQRRGVRSEGTEGDSPGVSPFQGWVVACVVIQRLAPPGYSLPPFQGLIDCFLWPPGACAAWLFATALPGLAGLPGLFAWRGWVEGYPLMQAGMWNRSARICLIALAFSLP